MTKKNNAIVFGGSGFLGQHIVSYLLEKKFNITIFDIKDSNIQNKKIKYIFGNTSETKKVEDAITRDSYVYHLSATADINQSSMNKNKTFQNNLQSTKNIVSACIKKKAKKIVFASTVYVNSIKGSHYKVSKRIAEEFILNSCYKNNLNFVILRYGSLYGPGAQDWNSISKFVKSIILKKKIVFDGSGEEIREYIHVKDAAKLSVDILDKIYKNRCLTLTGAQSIKIKNLFNILEEIYGEKIKIIFKNKKKTDHYLYTPYSRKIKNIVDCKNLTLNEYINLGQGLSELF
jgi:UDP-glucose 4-epimerase